MQKGLFIVFEGIDGCGKTTLSKRLKDWFIDNYHLVYWTCEPTYSKFGQLLRDSLNDPMLDLQFANKNEWFINLATIDRYTHLNKYHLDDSALCINQALEMGYNVICDRYIYSTYVYNCTNKQELLYAKILNDKFTKPDIVFYLEDFEYIASNELIKRGEYKYAEYNKVLNNSYKLSNKYRNLDEYKTFIILKNENNYDRTFDQIVNIVKSKLKEVN